VKLAILFPQRRARRQHRVHQLAGEWIVGHGERLYGGPNAGATQADCNESERTDRSQGVCRLRE